MHVFFDTNILVDVALRRESQPDAAFAFDHCTSEEKYNCWISWDSLSTLAYLIEKTEGHKEARSFLEGLVTLCQVATVGQREAEEFFHFDNGDLEDAMQISAANACKSKIIISRDEKGGFKKSPIKVVHPKEFVAGNK